MRRPSSRHKHGQADAKAAVAMIATLLAGPISTDRAHAATDLSRYREIVAKEFSLNSSTLADVVTRDIKNDGGEVKVIEARTAASLYGSKTCVRKQYSLAISGLLDSRKYRVVERDTAFSAAVLDDEQPQDCEKLASENYFRVEDDVDLNQLQILTAGVNRLIECAKGNLPCDFRMNADPWALLDQIAHTPEPARIIDVEKLKMRDYVGWLRAGFNLKRPGYYVYANFKLDETKVTNVELFKEILD